MFKFTYKVITSDRSVRKGQVRAFSMAAARKKCVSDGETLVTLKQEPIEIVERFIKATSFGFSKFERIIFFRNVSTMTNSGLSLVEALNTSAEIVRSPGAKRAILDISVQIENGVSLARAMEYYPRFFPNYIVETVRLGEMSGTLSDTLDQISVDLEKDHELSRKVIQALAYPVIILVVMIVLLLTLMVFVLPKIAALYDEMEVELPFITQALLDFGNSLSQYPFVYGLGLLLFGALTAGIIKTRLGRYVLHLTLLHLPVVKHIIKEFNLVKFFRSLETLVSSGASWVVGVDVAKKTLTNEVYRRAADTFQPVLIHGGTMSQALEPFPKLFPLQSRQILAVGERTGRFETTLQKISSYHEKSLDHTTKMMTTMIEPILMLVIGVAIGGIAISVFLPIYQLVEFI